MLRRTDIPYYIPVFQENPGWKPSQQPEKCSRLVEMVLEAAKEHDDFKLQALCLQELATRSQHPSRLLSELVDLQKIKQLDMQGYLRTCLTRYLICSDADSASKLRMDLLDVGLWDDSYDLLDPTSAAARDNIVRALMPNSSGGKTLSMKAALRYYQNIDMDYRRKIDAYIPVSFDGRDPRGLSFLSHAGPDTIRRQ